MLSHEVPSTATTAPAYVPAVIAGTAFERLTLTTRLAANASAGQAAEGFARVAETLALTRIDTLREEGHPKWKSVDLTDIPPGWSIASCVNRGLDPDYEVTCTAPEPAPAQTPEDGPDSQANEAYRRNICAVIGC